MTLVIRPAAPGDEGALAEVHVRAWQEGYKHLAPPERLAEMSVADRARFWRLVLDRPDRTEHYLVADVEGIAGFAGVGPARDSDEPDLGELWVLNVHPDRWRSGIGRALLAESERVLRDDGFGTAVLWVAEGNERGRRFYEALGWTPDGGRKRESLWNITFDELRYRRTLS